VINTLDLSAREPRLETVLAGQFNLWLNDGRKCGDRSIALREWIFRQRCSTCDNEKALSGMWIAEMVGAYEARPTTCHVRGAADLIAELLKAFANDDPRLATIMALEVTDIFEDDIRGTMPLEYRGYFVEQCSSGLILETLLTARLRKRLARKSRAQHVVRRYLVFAFADVGVHETVCLGKVLKVDLSEFTVDLGSEHALMAELDQGSMKAAETSEEVDELHRSAATTTGRCSASGISKCEPEVGKRTSVILNQSGPIVNGHVFGSVPGRGPHYLLSAGRADCCLPTRFMLG
jgi:hypothetical protein